MRVKDEIKNVVMKQLELQRLVEYKWVSAELEDVLNELRRLVEDRQSQYFTSKASIHISSRLMHLKYGIKILMKQENTLCPNFLIQMKKLQN